MVQKISIPVDADTTGATANIDKMGGSLGKSAQEANALAAANRNVARSLEEIDRVQKRLGASLGKPVSAGDASTFLDNFAALRNKSSSLRRFNTFDDWWEGHNTLYGGGSRAAAHRRSVLASGMQGTGYAAKYGAPGSKRGLSLPFGIGGGGGAAAAGEGAAGLAGMAEGAMGLLAGPAGLLLGLAGLSSLTQMAGQAFQMARDEGISTSNTRRRLGMGVGAFDSIHDLSRASATGLMTDFVGAAGHLNTFVKAAGRRDIDGAGGMLSTAGRFASAYGIDPGDAVSFFGGSARMGSTGDKSDRDARKFAGYIADAIEKSGYGAAAEEVLQAFKGYQDTITRETGTRANAPGYLGQLTALMRTGFPGLDAPGAANLMGQADAAIRGGGAAGLGGQDLLFRALMRPGMSPFAVHALWQSGLMGSPEGAFGAGPLKGWMKGRLDADTNMSRIRDTIRRMSGGNDQLGVEQFASLTGLSDARAAELYKNPALKLSPHEIKDLGKDPGQKSVDALNAIKDALTLAGQPLVAGVSLIGSLLGFLVERFVPNLHDMQAQSTYTDNMVKGGNGAAKSFVDGGGSKVQLGGTVRSMLRKAGEQYVRGFDPDVNAMVAGISDPTEKAAALKALQDEKGWIGLIRQRSKELHLDPKRSIAQLFLESNGFDPGATSRAGAVGIGQIMPALAKSLGPAFYRKFKRDPDRYNPLDSIEMWAMTMGGDMKSAHGNEDLARFYYHSGFDSKQWGKESFAYVPKINSMAGAYGGATHVSVDVSGHVVLQDSYGRTIGGGPVKQAGLPKPAGQ